MAPLDSMPPAPGMSGAGPTGENLEFTPEFAELERLAQGKPEQQYGTTIVPAEDPDWKAVIASAEALMQRTCDLRVMAQLAVARLHWEGLAGYAATVTQIRDALAARWDDVHPRLDPDDDNDPTLRANALLTVAQPVRVMRLLRTMPLARSVRAGTVSWRDVQVASGALEVPAAEPRMADAVIAAAFRDTDAAVFAALRQAVADAAAAASAIPAVFDGNAGHGTGPDFSELQKLLRGIAQIMDSHAPAAAAPEAAHEEAAPAQAGPAVPAAAPAMSIASMGPPTNRADAVRLLDLVIEFYERHEPSSPLPLLIARARRLAEMGFLDILRDMAPSGLPEAKQVAGTADEA